MRALIRRVEHAEVMVDDCCFASIGCGLLIYLGVSYDDQKEDVDWLVKKVLNMRIFDDSDGRMNLSVPNSASILVVSQFTLFGNMRKGSRPSFHQAASGNSALKMFESFFEKLKAEFSGKLAKGQFGADMKVMAMDDGPVTIWLDSRNKSY